MMRLSDIRLFNGRSCESVQVISVSEHEEQRDGVQDVDETL